MTNNNQLLVAGVDQFMEQMKYEIAQEFGVELGANATARDNGRIGGEMTRRMIQLAQEQMRKHGGETSERTYN